MEKSFTLPDKWLAKTPVHGRAGTFEELATQRLPELYRILQTQMVHPIPLSAFAANKAGAATLSADPRVQSHLRPVAEAHAIAKKHTSELREIHGKRPNKHEFAGVYVFLAGDRPFYVGITRTMYRRVQSHVRNLTHNTASLLFSLVRNDTQHKGVRGDLDFTSVRAKSIQSWLQDQSVAILPLACPVERYAFELYASMTLETGLWNTFETH